MSPGSAHLLVGLLTFASNAGSTPAVEWTEFRGPAGDGHVASSLPVRWSEKENVRWKTEVAGRGWSTPVTTPERIWMTTATEDGHNLSVICVARKDGTKLLERTLFEVEEPAPRNKLNSYASPSSVLDGDRLFVGFGTYGIACLDADSGSAIWSRDDVNLDHQEGPGSSMIVHAGRLIVHCDGRDQQYVIALDGATGKTVWRVKRSLDLSHVGDFARKAFTTPLIVRRGDEVRLISPAAQGCYCYDPMDGREIWRLKYPGFSAVPRPVAGKELTYVVDGFANPKIYAVRIDGKGDVTESNVEWTYGKSGPSTPSPILVGGSLLFVSDKGILSSVNSETGELRWKYRVGGSFCASPLVSNGLLYVFDREGQTTVIRPKNDHGEIVARNRLDDGLMASPAVSGDSLILRTQSALYCLEDRP